MIIIRSNPKYSILDRICKGGTMNRQVGRIGWVLLINLIIGGAGAIAQPFVPFQISNDPENSILSILPIPIPFSRTGVLVFIAAESSI